MLFTILAVSALVVACGALFFSYAALRYVRENTARSISLRKVVALESEMTDIVEAIDSMRKSMHKIRSRINMREKRKQDGDGLPLPNGEPTDPDEWYVWARNRYLHNQRSN